MFELKYVTNVAEVYLKSYQCSQCIFNLVISNQSSSEESTHLEYSVYVLHHGKFNPLVPKGSPFDE